MNIMTPLEILLQNYPQLANCKADIEKTAQLIIDCQEKGGTLFTCGNGGSCADADHISGELLKGFCRKRPMTQAEREALAAQSPEVAEVLSSKLQRGLRCISLMNFPGAGSAVRNDLGGELDVAQVLYALGRKDDVLLGISTSGNAKNVRYAVAVAKLKGMKVLGLTGEGGGLLAELADVTIRVPSHETYRIQEYHLPIYHALCRMVENHFFSE